MQYCPSVRFIIMHSLNLASFFAIAMGVGMLTIASIIDIKPPAKDALAYEKCVQLHPERYCGITYLGRQ